jgi:hypothetical protein
MHLQNNIILQNAVPGPSMFSFGAGKYFPRPFQMLFSAALSGRLFFAQNLHITAGT